MSVITKIKIWGLVGAAIVTASWLYLFNPLSLRGDEWTEVFVVVKFEPQHRREPVQVKITIDGYVDTDTPVHDSPWTETIMAHKGSLVMLSAMQRTQQLILTCTATVRNHTVGPSGIERQPDGTSNCAVAVTA